MYGSSLYLEMSTATDEVKLSRSLRRGSGSSFRGRRNRSMTVMAAKPTALQSIDVCGVVASDIHPGHRG